MPSIQAYSGVANPNVILTTTTDTALGITGDVTYNITIPVNGRVQFFNATSSGSFGSYGAGVGNFMNFKVLRNGSVLASGYLSGKWFYDNIRTGTMFYETLNFLSGAYVQAGEVFTYHIYSTGGDAQTMSSTNILTVGILPESSQFVI